MCAMAAEAVQRQGGHRWRKRVGGLGCWRVTQMCPAMIERRGVGARTVDVQGYPESVGARTEDVQGYPEVGLQKRALIENSNRSG